MSACEGVSGSRISLFIISPYPTHPTKKCMWQARPQHSRLRPPPFKQWCRFLMPSTCFRFHCKVMESSELREISQCTAPMILPVNTRLTVRLEFKLLTSCFAVWCPTIKELIYKVMANFPLYVGTKKQVPLLAWLPLLFEVQFLFHLTVAACAQSSPPLKRKRSSWYSQASHTNICKGFFVTISVKISFYW